MAAPPYLGRDVYYRMSQMRYLKMNPAEQVQLHQPPPPPPPQPKILAQQKKQEEEILAQQKKQEEEEEEADRLRSLYETEFPILTYVVHIPLGDQKQDNDFRMAILSELLRFQEYQEEIAASGESSNSNGSGTITDGSDNNENAKSGTGTENAAASDKENFTSGTTANQGLSAGTTTSGNNKNINTSMMPITGAVRLATSKSNKFEYVIRVPQYKLSQCNIKKAGRPPNMQYLDAITQCLFEATPVPPTDLTWNTAAVSPADLARDTAAGVMLQYMARQYHRQYLDHVDLAQRAFKKYRSQNKKSSDRNKVPLDLPDNLIMHDESDPHNPHNVRWNVYFQKIMDYKAKYGDFAVYTSGHDWAHSKKRGRKRKAQTQAQVQDEQPQEGEEEKDEEREGGEEEPQQNQQPEREYDHSLAHWVLHQRNNYKNKFHTLTPRRIELLNSIEFVWVMRPTLFSAVESVEYHKAVAAKLCYGISAVDAMLMAGLPEEESRTDSRKKLLNAHACTLYKKKGKSSIRPLVEIWLEKLYNAPTDEEEEFRSVLQEIYGESDLLDDLYYEGSLVPNPLHPSKRRRTDETLTEDGKAYVCHKPKTHGR
jgi:hypothetical protein